MPKFDLTKVSTAVKNKAGVVGFKIQAHSPEILLVVGIGTMVCAVVTAAFAGKKQEDIADDHLERVNKAKETEAEVEVTITNEDGEEVKTTEKVERSEKEIKQAVFKEYKTTAAKEAKCWAPTVGLMGISIGCFVGMHNIQASKIAGLSLANAGLSEAFKRYQENNIALNGQEAHEMCKNGFKTVKEEDEDGFTNEKKVMKSAEDIAAERRGMDTSSIFYDHVYVFSPETAPATYVKNRASVFNLNYLDSVERAVQTIVNTRGYVSADEAARMIDLQRSKEQIMIDLQDGWVRGGEPVRLGHRDPINNPFLSGKGNTEIILEFNVHGNLAYLLDQQAKAEKKVFDDAKLKREAEAV